jgi:hypothetical protein
MPDLQPSSALVAACGLYCGACKAYLAHRCKGCRDNDKATWCTVRSCCEEQGIASCASCPTHADARQCGKFDTAMASLFGLLFNSDRGKCIDQIRREGLDGHARIMAAQRRHTLPRR